MRPRPCRWSAAPGTRPAPAACCPASRATAAPHAVWSTASPRRPRQTRRHEEDGSNGPCPLATSRRGRRCAGTGGGSGPVEQPPSASDSQPPSAGGASPADPNRQPKGVPSTRGRAVSLAHGILGRLEPWRGAPRNCPPQHGTRRTDAHVGPRLPAQPASARGHADLVRSAATATHARFERAACLQFPDQLAVWQRARRGLPPVARGPSPFGAVNARACRCRTTRPRRTPCEPHHTTSRGRRRETKTPAQAAAGTQPVVPPPHCRGGCSRTQWGTSAAGALNRGARAASHGKPRSDTCRQRGRRSLAPLRPCATSRPRAFRQRFSLPPRRPRATT